MQHTDSYTKEQIEFDETEEGKAAMSKFKSSLIEGDLLWCKPPTEEMEAILVQKFLDTGDREHAWLKQENLQTMMFLGHDSEEEAKCFITMKSGTTKVITIDWIFIRPERFSL